LGEPVMKSYRDWNNGSPEESWEITEPAIYYQAAYLRSLAAISNREIVLPVTYRAPLTARPLAKSILLEWWIETETNASHYAVEYRGEHNAWQTIGRVSATGTSRYRFDHRTPREGENVYRLKQVDQDGAFAYSNLARAHFHDRYADITLFPNPAPANGSFQLTNLPAGTELRLVDASGRILRRTFLRGSSSEISTSGLPAGWYHLELSQGGEGAVWQRKLLVE
ncbi:MAG: T9SS type A sorting domain-containing protein, partial [Bacteroidota bacterium]